MSPALDEVIELHQFLSAWLRGETGKPGGVPLRLAHALSDDFSVIHPNGVREGKQGAIANFQAAWGSRNRDYSIVISDLKQELRQGPLQVVSYTESHMESDAARRRSTAIIDLGGQQPLWRYLQETRIA